MFARLSVLIVASCLAVFPATAQLFRNADRNPGPGISDLQRLIIARGTEVPIDIAGHRCERRPSSLFGQNTYRCTVTLTGGAEVTFVLTFDSGWVVVSR